MSADAPEDLGELGAVFVAVGVEQVAVEGSAVVVTVRSTATRDVVLQGGEATLGYALAYRYAEGFFGANYTTTHRRAHRAADAALAGPTLLRAGETVEQQVVLTVPADGPPSVNCALVNVVWAVGAHVRYDGTERADASPVPIAVLGAGRAAGLGDLDTQGGRRPDAVTIEDLPARTGLGPGDPVRGTVVMRAARGGEVRLVRLDLVLHQHVPHGPWTVDDPSRNPDAIAKDVYSVAERVVLAESLRVRAGEDLRWPFALAVPEDPPAPTLVTDEFSLRWLLRVTVARPRSRQTVADLELEVATRPAA